MKDIYKLLMMFIVLWCNGALVYAQVYDYHKRTEEEQKGIEEFGEKLVELALENYPDYSVANENIEISGDRLKMAKKAWLDQLSIAVNLNESAINPPSPEIVENVYYPRYNFGIQIPMGIFIRQPAQSRIAERMLEINKYEKEKAHLMIRKEVLSAYNDYLLRKDLYEIKVLVTEEEKATLAAQEDKFANGDINLDTYNEAIRVYNMDVERLLIARKDMDNAKLALEMWIGSKLEEVKN